MSNFEIAHKFTAEWEGGLSDDKFDAGGITKYGVSKVFLTDVYRESAANRARLKSLLNLTATPTSDDIKALTRSQAEELFKWQFWDRLGCDRFPAHVGIFLYDAGVNHGRGTAVKLMQRGCNSAGWRPQLTVDCMLGPKSREAFMAATKTTVDQAIFAREQYYRDIVKAKPNQSRFLKGWLNRAAALRTYIMEL